MIQLAVGLGPATGVMAQEDGFDELRRWVPSNARRSPSPGPRSSSSKTSESVTTAWGVDPNGTVRIDVRDAMNDEEPLSTIVVVDQRSFEVTSQRRSPQSSLLTVVADGREQRSFEVAGWRPWSCGARSVGL